MASVQYVHTQRFQAEVVAFIQHFTQLQDVLGRQRAAVEGQAVRAHFNYVFFNGDLRTKLIEMLRYHLYIFIWLILVSALYNLV